MSVSKFITRKFLKRFYKHAYLKTMYKGSILRFKDVVNLYQNIIEDGDSAVLFGSTFYGLEKVNYFTVDEIFTSQMYDFDTPNKQPVIIDCGANIGLSILYFKHKHKDALIYAFEPDKKNADYLEKNIQSYHWEKSVFLERKLVSDSNGFEYFDERGNAGSKIVSSNNASDQVSKIEKIRLKNFIENIDKPISFLKLDVEGSEFDIIPDIKPLFDKIERMYIEFHYDENDFHKMYNFIEEHLSENFYFQISTNFTEDQNIYNALKNRNSKTFYNCFLVNKNLS